MFQIKIGQSQDLLCKVNIVGCPCNGVEAIDFRRQHGLPDDPDKTIVLPFGIYSDEALARRLPLNSEADFELFHYRQTRYGCNAVGEVYGNRIGCYDVNYASPEAIRAYIERPNAETAFALASDIIAYEERSRVEAETQAAKVKAEREAEQQRMEAARALLKPELDRLEQGVAYWKGEAERLKEELEEVQADA